MQAKRGESDAKLIKAGSKYVQDENAQEARLHLHNEALEEAYDENTKNKIEKGELKETNKMFVSVYKRFEELLAKRGQTLTDKEWTGLSRAMPNQDGYPLEAREIMQFLWKNDGKFFPKTSSGKNLILCECCHADYGCQQAHSYEVSDEDKNVFEEEFEKKRKSDNGIYENRIEEAVERIRKNKVRILPSEEYDDFVVKLSDALLVYFDGSGREWLEV